MKILVAPDKFKGCLTALEAAHAIGEGVRSVLKDAEIVCFPIADGGEGTAEVLCRALEGSWQEIQACDPLGREITVRFCWIDGVADGPIAVMEMSEASGMWRLGKNELNPMLANTFGTGQMIRAAAAKGARKIIIGLGGSATNDGGVGMAAALGYRFLDQDKNKLEPVPANLGRIFHIQKVEDVDLPEILAVVDVRNPLLGPVGATRIYGPQKGADERQLEELEKGLKHLAETAQRDLCFHQKDTEGAGAAGGLGFGLLCFCEAQIRGGFDFVAETLDLEEAITDATFVLTAEGKLDSQTLQGKGPAGVAALARRHGKPVIALAGSIRDEEALNEVFDVVMPITPEPMDLDQACGKAAVFLSRAAARVARMIQLLDRS